MATREYNNIVTIRGRQDMNVYYGCTFSMENIQWAINPLKIPLDPPSCSVTMKVKWYIYTIEDTSIYHT